MSNIRPVDAPDVLLTFAGFSACFDRLMDRPVTVSPSRIGPMYPLKDTLWTDDQDDALVQMYAEGASYVFMGCKLGRSARACQMRLYTIGYGRP